MLLILSPEACRNLPDSSFLLDIVLNLISLNIRSAPFLFFFPGLFCVKNGFPFIKIRPNRLNIKRNGDRTRIAIPERTISQKRLKNGL